MNDCVQAKQLDGGALLGIPKAISLNLQNPNRFNSDVVVARDTSCCYQSLLPNKTVHLFPDAGRWRESLSLVLSEQFPRHVVSCARE